MTSKKKCSRVAMNTGNVLGVHYLYPTTKLYKSATCYRLEDEMQPVSFESLTLHYPGGTFEDASFRRVNSTPELWASLDEINEDEESEIWSEEEDSDSEDSLDGFIVRDEDVPESERGLLDHLTRGTSTMARGMIGSQRHQEEKGIKKWLIVLKKESNTRTTHFINS